MKDNNLEKNPRWIDGRKSYRKLAFERYGLKKICSKCGKEKDIDVHHIDKDHHNNNLSNLVILCGSCHNSLHKKNITHGPTFTRPHTEKSKKKISLKVSGEKNGFFGKKWSDYGGHPKGMKDKVHSIGTKKAQSEASLKMWKTRDRKMSDEQKKKLSLAHIGKIPWNKKIK